MIGPEGQHRDAHAGSLPPLRENFDFRLLWIGQLLSSLGTYSSSLAYTLLVLAITHSPTRAGLVGTASLLATLILRLPAGAIVDRIDRRRALLVCDGFRLAGLTAITIAVALGVRQWLYVLCTAILVGAASALFNPAEAAAVRTAVPPEQLKKAVAQNHARDYTAMLCGPSLGGFLFGIGKAIPFLADTASYFASLMTLRMLRHNYSVVIAPRDANGSPSLLGDIRDGLAALFKEPFLRGMALSTPLINLGLNGSIFLAPVILRLDGASSFTTGIAQAVVMGGALVGALGAPFIVRHVSASTLLLQACGLGAGLVFVAAMLSPSFVLVIPLALSMVLVPAANAALSARQMAITSASLQGRVSSSLALCAGSLGAIAPLSAGLLLATGSARTALVTFSGILALAGAVTLYYLPAIKREPDI